MPTIGHLFIGVIIPILFYCILYKKFTFLMGVIFVMGSILPDTFTILKEMSFLDSKVFNAPHGIVAWFWWSLMFTIIFKICIYCLAKKNEKYKIKFSYIYLILLSAGWIHLGLDMLVEPVRLFWKYYISVFSFYTPYGIMEEQDFIVFFYLFFMLIPIMLLLIVINKVDATISEKELK